MTVTVPGACRRLAAGDAVFGRQLVRGQSAIVLQPAAFDDAAAAAGCDRAPTISIHRTPATSCFFFLFSDMKEPPFSPEESSVFERYGKYNRRESLLSTKKSVCDHGLVQTDFFMRKEKPMH